MTQPKNKFHKKTKKNSETAVVMWTHCVTYLAMQFRLKSGPFQAKKPLGLLFCELVLFLWYPQDSLTRIETSFFLCSFFCSPLLSMCICFLAGSVLLLGFNLRYPRFQESFRFAINSREAFVSYERTSGSHRYDHPIAVQLSWMSDVRVRRTLGGRHMSVPRAEPLEYCAPRLPRRFWVWVKTSISALQYRTVDL